MIAFAFMVVPSEGVVRVVERGVHCAGTIGMQCVVGECEFVTQPFFALPAVQPTSAECHIDKYYHCQ